MTQDPAKQMITVPSSYNGDQYRRISNAEMEIEIGQSIFLDYPAMATSAAEPFVAESNTELSPVQKCLFNIVNVLRSTVTIDKIQIEEPAWEEQATVAPAGRETPNGGIALQSDNTSAEGDESKAENGSATRIWPLKRC